MQYGSRTSLEDERCQKMMDNSREFVDRIKEIIEEVKESNDDALPQKQKD